MRLTRRLALLAAAVTAAPLLLGGVAHAADSTISFPSFSAPVFANATELVSGVAADSADTINELDFDIGPNDSSRAATREATLTGVQLQRDANGNVIFSESLDVSAFADGSPLKVAVTAKDKDGAPSAQFQNLTIDRDPPTVTLSSTNLASQIGSSITDAFTITDVASSNPTDAVKATCQLDQGPVTSCGTPAIYTNVPAGQHYVTVTPIDYAGNVGTAAVQSTLVLRQNSAVGGAFVTNGKLTATHLLTGSTLPLVAVVNAAEYPTIPATGTVTVSEGSTVIGTAPIAATTLAPNTLAATLTTKVGKAGVHTLTFTYSGDAETQPSSSSYAYLASAPGTVTVKKSKISKNKLQLTLACPATAYSCSGKVTLGKAKASYSPAFGKTSTVSLSLDAKTLAALRNRAKVTLKPTFSDTKRHTSTLRFT